MTLYLYRKWRHAVTLLALMPALLCPVAAQWRAPRPERTTARALGVLEIFPGGARRLVPVTLYYERRYYDAGYYRAAPVPFTISAQTVYEVQRFGKPLGTFIVWNASRSPEGVWAGTGVFRTAPDPATLAKAKKTAAPVVLADPARPVLHRREGSEGERSVAKTSNTPAEEDDSERPRLHRRAEAADSATDQPASRTAASSAAEPAEDSAAGRPILRRGKPAEEQSGSLPAPAAATQTRNPEAVQRQVAVSDSGPSQPQELVFDWAEPLRSEMQNSARELARSELLRLSPMRGLSMPGAPAKAVASPQPSQSGTPSAPGAAKNDFQDEQFVPYDLDYKDYATVVFSARYRPPGPGLRPGAVAPAANATERSWVVTIIARQEGDKLVKLYSAVSDPRELDLYPEVRLVDAVDPEGYGRFALLFREQKRDGVSWLLGRVAGYELQTVFETAAR